MTEPQTTLIDELSLWEKAGKRPRLFLRDDDAVENTPALQILFQFCQRFKAPVLLASIPRPAKESLGAAVRDFPLATGAVHGFAHVSHSGKGEKPCELGSNRALTTVLSQLREGRAKLEDLFDGRISGLLVPPWNRIHDGVASYVHETGFTGISAHGWLVQKPPHSLAVVNAHIDIVHWSGGQRGRKWQWVAGELAKAFHEARLRGFRATGILAHHLAHDAQAWTVLDEIGKFAADNDLQWVAADDLISEPSEQPAPLSGQA